MANVTILPEDYDGLKKEYLVLRKELDTVNQELYGCKRQLKVIEALQHEYQSEIEILQSEENAQKLKQEEKVAQLEENIGIIRSKYNERIRASEAELTLKEDEIENLKAEIEFLKKNNALQNPTEDISKIFDEIVDLRYKNDVLLENEEELKLSLDILQKNSLTLEETLIECKEELLNLKESLSCKRDELMEANDLVQKLNDELFCLKTELESYKSKPLNTESKGNSLFAEVDDRRVYLQKTVNSMKSEYISMKQERAKHLNTISHLKKENKTLCELWKKDMEEKEDDQDMVMKAYKDQIHILENLLEKYKQDLAAKPVLISTGTFSEIEFYQIMLNNKIKELEELREQLKSRSLTQTVLSTALKQANKEIRKWRLEATLKQYQLELQPDDSISDSVLSKKIDEEIGNSRIELKRTMTGPYLACGREEEEKRQSNITERRHVVAKNVQSRSKEVIAINDSTDDDVQIVEGRSDLRHKREKSPEIVNDGNLGILKDKQGNIISQTDEEEKSEKEDAEIVSVERDGNVEQEIESSEEKENGPDKVSRKVTFSQSTVSPKATDRTALRKNCRRLVVPKPIFIPSE